MYIALCAPCRKRKEKINGNSSRQSAIQIIQSRKENSLAMKITMKQTHRQKKPKPKLYLQALDHPQSNDRLTAYEKIDK